MKKISVFVEMGLIAIVAMWVLSGCAPRKYAYKVIFRDGTVEYYELDYKPKNDTKAIEYEGHTIIGVEQIEKIK